MTRTAIPPAFAAAVPGRDPQLDSSIVNSLRVATIAQRLASHVRQPQSVSQIDAADFFHLCIALARGIDNAIANDDIPAKAQNLPSLLKKVCQQKSDLTLRAAIMVLMISVKSACRVGWFSAEERKEICDLANEIGNDFSGLGDTNPVPSNMVFTISTIMTRFYPLMKMGQILAYLDIKPGYGAFMVDFHILKGTEWSPQEKIRLFVAQADNIETSACIISPQQANFIVNGKGLDKRSNILMDTGPQLPTNLTAMLKFGTNLVQVVGQFNGHYIVVVACMSMAASLETPVLQDYLQSGTTIQDSDSDIIEGPSRISLNCPISYTRIRIPVKGHSCKHLQCFDFSNFIHINSRRPSWRCPHCNQHVCYTDIRVDQIMVKVLREVGENVTDVIISSDGSWRAVLESDENVDTYNNTFNRSKERFEQLESTDCMNSDAVVLDLTTNDEEMDAASADEIQDTKPLLANLQNQTVATVLSELNNTVGVNQNVGIQSENNFQATGFQSNGSAMSGGLDAGNDGGISEPMFANRITSPVLTDAISPALDRGAEGCDSTELISEMQGHYSAPGNLQLQQSQFVDANVDNEYGRFSLLNRNNINRTPIAVQALPATSQTPSQRQRVGINSLTPDGSSVSSQAASSVANDYRANSIEVERNLRQQQHIQHVQEMQQRQLQLQHSRSHLNTFMRPDVASSPLQHHSAPQVAGLPASVTHLDSNHVSSGLLTENQYLHQQQAVNLRMPQFRTQSPSSVQVPLPFSQSSISQGGAQPGVGHTAGTRSGQHARVMHGAQRAVGTATQYTRQAPTVPVQVPTSRTGTSFQVRDGVRVPTGEQRVNIGGMQAVRPDNVVDLTSEQNWRPTGRMRGSLSGQAYSAALSQFMIRPTQQTQPARTQPIPTTPVPSIPPGLQAYLGNRSAHVPQPQNNSNTVPANMNGGSGILPDRSLGTR